ncbi:MAG: MFS transporter [Anaerolineales bacterium]|nr:MFS transporter [Anaerolineales bacterium]
MLSKIRTIYQEYPPIFWGILGAMFIDRLGGALIFPFFALYITAKYGVGMTQVGILFTIISTTTVAGSLMGGALTDKFGRKAIIIFGLIVSAASTLLLAFAPSLKVIYAAGAIVGLFGHVAGPAHQAMIADVLPEKKRADGFGLLRVIANLAVTLGPAIGGLLAAQSYTLLFIIDVITSTITALIFFLFIPETKPAAEIKEGETEPTEQSLMETLGGYWTVLQDKLYLVFMFGSLLMVMAYMQMNSTLSVFLRDMHGVSDQGYGFILSLNAGMVVLFQFMITRRIKHIPPMITMVVGTLFYAVGFTLYGFIGVYWLFLVAMVIITIGEMIVSPTGQALVAAFSPVEMRGRYMAVYGFTWTIPSAIGPLGAGLIMDNYNPNWVWYGSGIILLFAAGIYTLLHLKAGDRIEELNAPKEESSFSSAETPILLDS